MTKHIKQWRINQLEEFKKILDGYKVIGIGDLNNFPAALLHKLRKNVVDIDFKVTNRNVLIKALDSKSHKEFLEKLPNQPILILTNKNAFELYSQIKKNKAKSKAKVGMISPIDIIVPEGDTGLPPGPALSDLKKVGIKAQVKGATIHVTSDTTIVKQGEVINEDIVSTLSKLDIKPVELILDVVSVKEDGILYSKDVLDVSAQDIYNDIITAVRSSINLGVEIGYANKLTIEPMIVVAQLKAKALDEEVNSFSNDSSKEKNEDKKE